MSARSLPTVLLAGLMLAGCPGSKTDDRQDGGQPTEGGQLGDVGSSETTVTPGVARDGKWKGQNISFSVMLSGTFVFVHDLDYTSCTRGGCTDTASLTNCHTCNVAIKGGAFSIPKHHIQGTFTSATTASGTASEEGDFCGCTMKINWTARWVSK